MSATPPPPSPLLSVRAAVVFFGALVIGLLAGTLSFLAAPNVPAAVLVGGGALAVALPLLHAVIGKN